MAKKSNLTHYVYYDKKSGQILSVGNEKDDRYEHGLRVAFEDVERFLTGEWHFRDYLIGYKRDADGTSTLAVVPNTDQGYAFKNNVFEWITETDKDCECLIIWNGPNKTWDFSINKKVTNTHNTVLAPKLVFFVTLENDFDFLVRTIFINLQDLISTDTLSIPFESTIETKIDKISISSKLVFKTYGLKVINEN